MRLQNFATLLFSFCVQKKKSHIGEVCPTWRKPCPCLYHLTQVIPNLTSHRRHKRSTQTLSPVAPCKRPQQCATEVAVCQLEIPPLPTREVATQRHNAFTKLETCHLCELLPPPIECRLHQMEVVANRHSCNSTPGVRCPLQSPHTRRLAL